MLPYSRHGFGFMLKPLWFAFEKLKIAQSPDFETYLNQFNVIYLDVNAFYSNSKGDEDIVPLFTASVRRDLWILSIRDEDDYAKAIAIVKHSEELLELTINGDENAAALVMNDAHEELVSNLQYNNEGCFQSVIRFAYFYENTRYTVISELRATPILRLFRIYPIRRR